MDIELTPPEVRSLAKKISGGDTQIDFRSFTRFCTSGQDRFVRSSRGKLQEIRSCLSLKEIAKSSRQAWGVRKGHLRNLASFDERSITLRDFKKWMGQQDANLTADDFELVSAVSRIERAKSMLAHLKLSL